MCFHGNHPYNLTKIGNWIGHIPASNEDRALMSGSYERSLKALSQFYNLVVMATYSLSLSCSFVSPMDKKELVISQLPIKVEPWCLVHMKGLWTHLQNFIIWLLWQPLKIFVTSMHLCPPWVNKELVISQVLIKIEDWCLVHMKGLWKHFYNFIIWFLWQPSPKNLCHPHTTFFPHGHKRIGHLSASNENKALMFVS